MSVESYPAVRGSRVEPAHDYCVTNVKMQLIDLVMIRPWCEERARLSGHQISRKIDSCENQRIGKNESMQM